MFFDKILDAFKMENIYSRFGNNSESMHDNTTKIDLLENTSNKSTTSIQNQIKTIDNATDRYSISLSDIQKYDGKPFHIDNDLLVDHYFTYIPFSDMNKELCIEHIHHLNQLIYPLRKYTRNAYIPEDFWSERNPNPWLDNFPSQIRFVPYTPKMRTSKYPVYAFICNISEYYGTQGIQSIYYKQNGEIGKADLYFPKNKNLSFRIQIREKDNTLYVRRIDSVQSVGKSHSAVPYLKTKIQYIVE